MSVNSAIGLFSSPNIPINLTIIEIPLQAPVATASSAGFTVINNFIVPKGTWLLSGDVGLTSTVQANQIIEWLTSIIQNATLLSSVRGGNNYWLGSALMTTMPFVSDGTDTLTFQIVCSTSAGTWQTEPQGTGSGVYLIQIGS